jgi:hypothetical protein
MWEGYETGRTKDYDMDHYEDYLVKLRGVIDWLVADEEDFTQSEMEAAVKFMHDYWHTIDRDTLVFEVHMLCKKHDFRSPDARFTLTDRFYEFMARSIPFFEEKRMSRRIITDFLERVTVFPGHGGELLHELPSPYHELALEAPRYLKDYDPVLVENLRRYNTGRFQEPIRSAMQSVRRETLESIRERFGERAV